jgi:pimeloyl-ACP methyl ester carboxylesterase
MTLPDPLLHFGRWLIQMRLRLTVNRAGFQSRAVLLDGGVRAAYLERAGDVENPGTPLLVLPGMSTSAQYMAMRTAYLARTFIKRRIVIMELPHHGLNASGTSDFTKHGVQHAEVAQYTLRFADAIGLNTPFDTLGYSYGGGLGALIQHQQPERVRKLILIAPFLLSLSTQDFLQMLAEGRWREIHGWESYEEMVGFFSNWLGMNRRNKPPAFFLRAFHSMRAERYAPSHFSRLFESIRSSMDADTVAPLPKRAAGGPPPEVLILAGERDRCCDVNKMHPLAEALGADKSSVHVLSAGHSFADRVGKSVFDISRDTVESFLR